MAPRDLPPYDHYPHGARAKYVKGCRCEACLIANRLHARARARAIQRGYGNPVVDAAPVRRHLRALQAQGVGTRAVVDATDLGRTCIGDIRSGKKRTVRRLTAERILRVTTKHRADSSFVPKARTLQLVRQLLLDGYSRAAIARAIGLRQQALPFLYQHSTHVTARTALKVQQFYLRTRD